MRKPHVTLGTKRSPATLQDMPSEKAVSGGALRGPQWFKFVAGLIINLARILFIEAILFAGMRSSALRAPESTA